MAATSAQPDGIVVPKEEMQAFIVRCMRKVGTDDAHAEALAEVLVAGDYRGHFSHGLNRLQMYVTDIEKGVCQPSGKPVVVNELAATALVDGKNVLGPVVGKFCMELAIQKAQQAGIGWVVAKGHVVHQCISTGGTIWRKEEILGNKSAQRGSSWEGW